MQRHRPYRYSQRLGVFLVAAVCCSCNSGTEQTAVAPAKPTESFGHRQIEQMLDDRPDMVDVLGADDPVLQWIIDSLNGSRTGFRIYWNADSPLRGRAAHHQPRYHGYPAHFCISGGTETTPIDKWAAVVYELFNLENGPVFDLLNRQALGGTLDGETFALECDKTEFEALKKSEVFFAEHPLPTSGSKTNAWYDWVCAGVGTYDEYRNNYFDSTKPGNFKYFRDYYDESISPWVGKWEQDANAD